MHDDQHARNMADAFSDVHLVTARFEGAEVSGDGDFRQILSAYEMLATSGRDVAAAARSRRWRSGEMTGVEDAVFEIAAERREMACYVEPVVVDARTALMDFARGAMDFTIEQGDRLRRSVQASVRSLLSGGSLSSDGGDHLAARFAAFGLRSAKMGAVALAFGGGVAGPDAVLGLRVAPANAQEWIGPTEVVWEIAAHKLRDEGGNAMVAAFYERAEEFYEVCVEEAGEPLECRLEMGDVVFDFSADRYVIADPLNPAGLVAIQESGRLRIVEAATNTPLDLATQVDVDRVVEWMMPRSRKPENIATLDAGPSGTMAPR